jgi:hypothetical protein
MDTFPIVRRKDEAEYGEYRTKRVILEIYDEMAEAGLVAALGDEENSIRWVAGLGAEDPQQPAGGPDAGGVSGTGDQRGGYGRGAEVARPVGGDWEERGSAGGRAGDPEQVQWQ